MLDALPIQHLAGAAAFPAQTVGDLLGNLELHLNTVWLLTATALVFFMQLGFAFVEGGSVRSKNTVNVIMKNFTDMCFGGLAFWLFGYGIMFGINETGWFGTDHFAGMNVENWDYTMLLFQMMFAATAATIVSGALAERIRYWPYVICSIIMTSVIYTLFGSWAWGSFYGGTEGWLRKLGFIDFAGSTVVHSVGGWAALAGIIVLGPRLGRFAKDGAARVIPGHNLPLVAAGGFILWMGWFGFNGGSAFEANADLGKIVLNTHLGGSAGLVGSFILLGVLRRPILMTSSVNGALAGLVSVTAGTSTMEPVFAILTGFVAGVLMVGATNLLEKMGLDDPVGAVPVHGVAGAWGTLAAGLFFSGDLFNMQRVTVQAMGIGAAFIWAFGSAFVMFKVVDKFLSLRVSTLHEQRGLDFTEHYEIGYPEFQADVLHAGKEAA